MPSGPRAAAPRSAKPDPAKPQAGATGQPIGAATPQAGPRLGFRHCDPRFGFLWTSDHQPPARWHGAGEGPAHYLADTPDGAWAEFLRHEGITDPADLPGIRRSLWAVELPALAWARPRLPATIGQGGLASHRTCQAEARRLRAAGHRALQAPSAALVPGGARGWVHGPSGLEPAQPRDGQVWVCFGAVDAVGWQVVEAGSPPASLLPRVRPLGA